MQRNNPVKTALLLRKKITIIIFGLFLFFVLLEVSLRLGGFILLSMQEYRNLQSIKQKGAYRIMCLGESTTQNQYPVYLEEILNQHNVGIKFSVIDKGLTASNTGEILGQLETNLEKYQPDIVVVMMGSNDRKIMYYRDIPEAYTWLFRHCRVYRFSRIIYMHILKKLKKEDVYSFNMAIPVLNTAYRNHSEPLAAKKSSEKTVEFKFKDDSVYARLGRVYKEQGKLYESEQIFNKAIGLNSKDDSAYVGLGSVYKDQAKYSDAELVFKKAIDLNPQNDSAYVELAQLYRDLGKFAESEHALKKIIEINPMNNSAYAELGRLYKEHGRYSESEQILKKAIGLNPKDDIAYEGLGWLYKDLGRIVDQEQAFKKAIEFNPGNSYAYIGLGSCYRSQGKLEESEQMFKKAAGLDPWNDFALGGLATLYCETGNNELAQAYSDKLNSLRGWYNPVTVNNYYRLEQILNKRKIKLVCVQYPMRILEPLKKIFKDDENIIFVDNERIFKEALRKDGYNEYFVDMFAGDFGHCTDKGNRLLAKNIANVILKEIFNK